MKTKAVTGARLLLGLIFFVFGLNGFLNFIPMPAEIPEPMKSFAGALMQTGYFFPFLKGTEVLCGIFLLANFWTPLALVILSPIVLNILAVHTFLDRSGFPMAIAITVLMIFLGKAHMKYFRPLFTTKAQPSF